MAFQIIMVGNNPVAVRREPPTPTPPPAYDPAAHCAPTHQDVRPPPYVLHQQQPPATQYVPVVHQQQPSATQYVPVVHQHQPPATQYVPVVHQQPTLQSMVRCCSSQLYIPYFGGSMNKVYLSCSKH